MELIILDTFRKRKQIVIKGYKKLFDGRFIINPFLIIIEEGIYTIMTPPNQIFLVKVTGIPVS